MEQEKILSEFNQTFTDFESAVAVFDDVNINQIPFAGSWTAGQVAQHLILGNKGFADILGATVKDTDRAIDGLIPQLKEIFLNFEVKLNAPDFILPPQRDYKKSELLPAIQNIRETIVTTIHTLPLDKTCVAFELPTLGYLTRLEAIYFVIYHTQRHIRQLKKIYELVKLS